MPVKKSHLLFSCFIFFFFLSSLPVYSITKNYWSEELKNNVVINPFQGLGLCHWSSPGILDDPIVAWSYDATGAVFWKTIEPVEGQYNWQSIDNLVNLARLKGKKLWLQLYNANIAAIPDWAKNKTINGKKMVLMGQDYQPFDCTNMAKALPLPWDEVYLTLWQKVIHEMAIKYDNNPTVEAIITMAGGGYGEMVICNTCGPDYCWAKFAGCCTTNCSGCKNSQTCIACVDNKFAQSVKKIVDLYLSEFQNKPVLLQLGSGVKFPNKSTAAVIKPVLDYAIPKYGMRVLLKSNGWHCGSCTNPTTPCDWGHGGVCPYYLDGTRVDRTKYGLEPGFPTNDYNTEAKMIECGKQNSYACLQPWYWGQGDGDPANLQKFRPLRESLARSLGSKVAIKEVTYPEAVVAGQSYPINATLKNLGEIPPFRPKREELKDKAGTYKMTFQLFKDGKLFMGYATDLSPPSDKWVKDQEINISFSLEPQSNFPSGDYELRLGLHDPEGRVMARQEYFRFLNKELLDEEGRAKIGMISLSNPHYSPGPTQTITPTLPIERTTVYSGINFLNSSYGKNFDKNCPFLSVKKNSFWQSFLLTLADLTGLSKFYLKCQ